MTLVGNRELSLIMNWVPELLGSGNSFQNALARKRALFACFGAKACVICLLWRESVLDVFALAPKRAFICLLWLESVLVF